MTGETLDWLDCYYEAVEFFYWEPQHLRVKTHAAVEATKLATIAKNAKSVEQVRGRLRQMEVTLNHNIQQFFSLAPTGFRNNLFGKVFGDQFNNTFVMQGREVDEKFALKGCMQPDLVFMSEREVVSVEMKIKSKCSVSQVLKYALLGLAIERQQKAQKQHYLVLLGPGDITKQFRERFLSSDDLNVAIKKKELLSAFLAGKPPVFCQDQQRQRLEEIVDKMKVRFLSYKDLTDTLVGAVPQQADQSAGAEVYRNLISGLCREISDRKLL